MLTFINLSRNLLRYGQLLVLLLLLSTQSCKRLKHDVEYELNSVDAETPSQDKTKAKTTEQYISILYANIFQKAISPDDLYDIGRCIASIGDKDIAHEIVVSNFMNRSDKIIPSDSAMRADTDRFINETYRRFYVRDPSIAEKTWLKNYLLNNPQISAELIYMSFALSNEYQYY